MEKLDLSKLKLAGERIKTSGVQMGRTISSKMKEILQAPTPESKVVDEATFERMEEPNWGLNLRICAMIGREEYDGAEIVKAIKKKLVAGKNPNVQCLSLDLLEACTSNCEKVLSEVASEKVLEDMVKLIEDPKTDPGVRVREMQLIRAWGESEDLEYLPVFHQTYMYLRSKEIPPAPEDGSLPSMQFNTESYLGQDQISAPQMYPIPSIGPEDEGGATFVSYGFQSIEDKKEYLVVTRNSADILSSILNSDVEPKPLKDDLTVGMLERCKQSLPILQRIIENTSEDEVMLFDALNLHEELQRAISQYSELADALEPGQPEDQSVGDVPVNSTPGKTAALEPGHLEHQSMGDVPGNSTPGKATLPLQTVEHSTADKPKVGNPEPGKLKNLQEDSIAIRAVE